MSRERSFNMIRTVVSMLVAILVAFVIILIVSDQPVESIKVFLVMPFSSGSYLGNIVETAVPLIFSGLAMAVMFKANLFNLGGEGIFFIAGAVGSFVAIWPKFPSVLAPLAAIVVGTFTGMVVMMVPGGLKAKYGANEMVTSLMMNNILLGVGLYLLNNVLRDPGMASLVSYKYRKKALLANIVPGTRIHAGFLIAIACAVLVYFFMYKSKWGYEIRMTGNNAKFASYSGINVAKVILIVHMVAGAIAGAGGIIECIGLHKRFEWTALPGYGFDGAMIAMLAGNNPLGVIGAAFFVSYLRVGADLVNRSSDIPTEMIAILQSIIILLISAERFLHKYKQRWIEKGEKK